MALRKQCHLCPFAELFPRFLVPEMPALVLETEGKSLKLVQTILGMNLIPFRSEVAIKKEMADPGSLKSLTAKGKGSDDLHWGRARDKHLVSAYGPVLVPWDLRVLYWQSSPPPTHFRLKMYFCYTLIINFKVYFNFLAFAFAFQKTISQPFNQMHFNQNLIVFLWTENALSWWQIRRWHKIKIWNGKHSSTTEKHATPLDPDRTTVLQETSLCSHNFQNSILKTTSLPI